MQLVEPGEDFAVALVIATRSDEDGVEFVLKKAADEGFMRALTLYFSDDEIKELHEGVQNLCESLFLDIQKRRKNLEELG